MVVSWHTHNMHSRANAPVLQTQTEDRNASADTTRYLLAQTEDTSAGQPQLSQTSMRTYLRPGTDTEGPEAADACGTMADKTTEREGAGAGPTPCPCLTQALRATLEALLQDLGALERSLRSIRDQFIPHLQDASSTAGLGRIILQELLLDMDGHIAETQDHVATSQAQVQEAKLQLLQAASQPAATSQQPHDELQLRRRILALQNALKRQREQRNKAWAQVVGMLELREAVRAAVDTTQPADEPTSFELAKMKQQYLVLHYQKHTQHTAMALLQARLQLLPLDERYVGHSDHVPGCTAVPPSTSPARAPSPRNPPRPPIPPVFVGSPVAPGPPGQPPAEPDLPSPPPLPAQAQVHVQPQDRDGLAELLQAYGRAAADWACIRAVQGVRVDTGEYAQWFKSLSWAERDRERAQQERASSMAAQGHLQAAEGMGCALETEAVNSHWLRLLRPKQDLLDCLLATMLHEVQAAGDAHGAMQYGLQGPWPKPQ